MQLRRPYFAFRASIEMRAPRLTIPTTDGGALAARTVLALRLAVLRLLQLLRQRKHLALSLRPLRPRGCAAEVPRLLNGHRNVTQVG